MGDLFGYHVTSRGNLESISNDGLMIGNRKMQGGGLYSFYSYEHALRYARKGETDDVVIVKFKVLDPSRLLILNSSIARKFLDDYHLVSQLDNYMAGGIDSWYEMAKVYDKELTKDKYIDKINDIESNDTESNQRMLMFNMIPTSTLNKLNILWNGNYGLEFRINNLNLIDELGYLEVGSSTLIPFRAKDPEEAIPGGSEFDELRNIYQSYNGGLKSMLGNLERKQNSVRSNSEFDYFGKLIKQVKSLLR